MRKRMAFVKKEVLELIRSGKLVLLLLIFILFGIMNPAIAKLTPWMMRVMSGSLADIGMTVSEVEVTALTSWTQFYKNIPLGMVLFLVLSGGILTVEYQRGTLIQMLTKGVSRKNVIFSKTAVTVLTWTGCYWLCYGITYAYNAYFWDNSVASHVVSAAAYVYLLGIWLILLLIFFSVVFRSSTAALAGTAVVTALGYLLQMIPKMAAWLPTYLFSAGGLTGGAVKAADMQKAGIVTGVTGVILLGAAVVLMNRKKIV